MKKINSERSVVQLLLIIFLLPASMLLVIACKKKDNFIINMPIPITNTDSMQTSTGSRYLALGDSYTIGTSVEEKDRYPVQVVDMLKKQAVAIDPADIIATNGWTTADLLNGIDKSSFSNSYDAVSLLIGVNNQYQGRSIEEYKTQFTALVERAVRFAKGKADHVIVLSIPDYSVTPFANGRDKQKIAAEIDTFNAANQTISTAYHVQYLYVTDESRKAANDLSLVAADGLHFSGKEYSIWAGRLAPMVKGLLQ